MRRHLRPVLATALLTASLSSASPAAAHPRVDGEESVLAWNLTTVQTVVSVTAPAGIPAPVQPMFFAYVHRAVYSAVEAADRDGASVPAAVAAAAHDVLDHHFPSAAQQSIIEPAYTTALAGVPDGDAKASGIAIGQEAAAALIGARAHDGLAEGMAAPPLALEPYEPGVWRPVPPLLNAVGSYLGSVDPFVLESPSQFRPDGPPALRSARYARDFEEVRVHGSSANPSTVETDTGWFWADPPGVQSQRALRLYAADQDLDAREAARLFALTNTASADALIACADAKFTYDFWRPVTAIPAAGEDRNPATVAQPGWAPLVPTPNFPEYPSNHSCTTTAVVSVIDALDGEGPFSLTISSFRGSPPVLFETQEFTSAREVIADVANGRVFGGMHFRFSTTAGTDIGRSVAALVVQSDQ